MAYTRLSEKNWKLDWNLIWGVLFGTFCANTTLFQIRTLISKDSVTLAKEAQFISVDSNRRVV